MNPLDESFTKDDAIRRMLDGYRIIEINQLAKRQYMEDFYICFKGKFYQVGPTHKPLNINNLQTTYYRLAKITDSIVPEELYRTNLDEGTIQKVRFNKVVKEGLDAFKNPWAICEYIGYKSYTLKMTFKPFPGKSASNNYKDYHLDIDSVNFHYNKSSANYVLREFVNIETIKQSKRHISKPELKTMKTVRAIIDNHPEVLV